MFPPIRQSLAHKVLDPVLTGRFRAKALTEKNIVRPFLSL
jgi:hypothetical protein